MKSYYKTAFILLGAFLLSSMSVSGSIAQTTPSDQSSVNMSGTLLDPSYLYISGQTMQNSLGKEITLQTGDQPSYYAAHGYSGNGMINSYSGPSGYIPANYSSNKFTGLNSVFGYPSYPSSSDSYFLEFGDILPNTTEQSLISGTIPGNSINTPNYSSYPSNYPFHDKNYVNTVASSSATLKLSFNSIQATIKVNGWYKFDLNQSSSYSIVLQAPKGIYSLYSAQYYGSTSGQVYSTNQTLSTFSNTGASSQVKFFSTLGNSNDLIYISLQASQDSEIFLRVNSVNSKASNLQFNQDIQSKNDIKEGNNVLSGDPYRAVAKTQIKSYKFIVPSSLDGKMVSVKFDYNSNYFSSYSAFIYSETSNKLINANTNFIGHQGDVIDIIFPFLSYDPYYYNLEIVQSHVNTYQTGQMLDVVLQNNPIYTFHVSSNTLFQYVFENSQNYYYTQFQIYNSSNYFFYSPYGFKTGVVNLSPGDYFITFSGSGVSQFSMQPINPVTLGTTQSTGLRNGALFSANLASGSLFSITIPSNNVNSQVQIAVYDNTFSYAYNSQVITLSTAQTTNININPPSYSSGLYYIYVIPILIAPTGTSSLSLSLSSTGQTNSNGQTTNNQVSVTYSQPGTFSITNGDTTTHRVEFDLNQLTPKTWNIFQIATNNMVIQPNVELFISPIHDIYVYSLGSLPDYSVYTANSTPMTSFGFGALSSGVKIYLNLNLQNSYALTGSITVSLKKMNTKELVLTNPQLGTPMSTSKPNLDQSSGSTPGFELATAVLVLSLPVVYRKIKKFKQH